MLKLINFDATTYGMKNYEKTVRKSSVKELKKERKLILDLLEDAGEVHKVVQYYGDCALLRQYNFVNRSGNYKCWIDDDYYFYDNMISDRKAIRQAKNRFKLVSFILKQKKSEDEETTLSEILNKTTLNVK